jgi:hypothetical protein
MYWNLIKRLFFVGLFVLVGQDLKAQVSVQTFVDPCTKEVTLFTVPLQGGTTIFFLNKSRYFTAADVTSGVFSSWVNQTYTEYRQTNPCSQQQGQVTQNQITSQIISSTVQSVVGSIMSSAQSSSSGGNLNAGNNNKKDGNKQSNRNSNGSGNNNNGSGSSSQGGENGGQSQGSGGTTGTTGGTNSSQGGSTGTQGGNGTGSNNPPQGGSGSSQPPVGGSGGSGSGGSGSGGSGSGGSGSGGSGSGGSGSGGSGSGGSGSGGSGSGKTSGSTTEGSGSSGNNGESSQESSPEVGSTITMNNDAHNDNGGDGGTSGGGKSGDKKNGKSGSTNPLIISSDLTTAQNLDNTFTPILNLSTNRSSMTGLSSVGVTGMVWFNLKQFAVSAKYTKLNYNKKNTIKYIHNVSLTGVYTYGNILGFLGYSGIINAGKFGVTGFNVSGAVSIISEDKSGFYSPSLTAFYTRPFKAGKKIIISPELYIMSTPLVYSTKEQVTITDRFFSAFVGSGFDYQISKRFKLNMNYKANLSSNPDIPILSFFLIGSKVNL